MYSSHASMKVSRMVAPANASAALGRLKRSPGSRNLARSSSVFGLTAAGRLQRKTPRAWGFVIPGNRGLKTIAGGVSFPSFNSARAL